MARHVAFLGGLNVGKAHRVSMADLKEHFAELGFDDISTVINSGNVIFSTAKKAKLDSTIAAHLEKALGYAVPTFVRTDTEVRKLADASPFGDAEGTVLIGFLEGAPSAAVRNAVGALGTPSDTLKVVGTELWWHLPDGQMGSKLPGTWGKKSGLGPMTTRNLTMLRKLAAKLD